MTSYVLLSSVLTKGKQNNQRIVSYIKILSNQGARHCFNPKNTKQVDLEFRAIWKRHHLGLSGIESKRLYAPYGILQARWVKCKTQL